MTGADARLDDSLNQYLDELAGNEHQPPDGHFAAIDPGLAQTASRLRVRDDALAADSAFADRLLSDIMAGTENRKPDSWAERADTAVPSRIRTALRRGSFLTIPRIWPSPGWSVAHLATAALIVLTVASSFFAFGPGRPVRHERGTGFIPAAPAPPVNAEGAASLIWESMGNANLPLNNPGHLSIDPAGNLWVTDGLRNAFQILSPDGEYIESWGVGGTNEGQFNLSDKLWSYGAAAFDRAGNLYVADFGNHRIQKFAPDRSFLLAWGGTGKADGQFLWPDDLTVDEQGQIYVLDAERDDIQVFDADGAYLRTIGESGVGDGQLMIRPGGGAISVDKAGSIWVADVSNHRVQKFSVEGAFLTAFGGYGNSEGKFTSPSGVAVDGEGRVYVTDVGESGTRMQVFSPSGEYLAEWNETAGGAAELSMGASLVLDDKGNIYISDLHDDRIQKLRLLPPLAPMDANAARAAGSAEPEVAELIWQTTGGTNHPLDHPTGLAIDPEGNVWVTDTQHHQYKIFTPEGELLKVLGEPGTGPGQFNFMPAGENKSMSEYVHASGGVAFTPDGGFYVADAGNHRVQRFDSDGRFLFAWGNEGKSDGQFLWPGDVAVDGQGRVYVADNKRNDIQVFDANGTFLHAFGEFGFGDGQLYLQTGGFIEIDRDGNILVSDGSNGRVQKFSADGEFLTKVGGPSATAERYDLKGQVAADESGRVFGTDWTRLVVLAPDGTLLATWDDDGLGLVYSPAGIALDGQGNVYVSDVDEDRLLKFRLLPPLGPG